MIGLPFVDVFKNELWEPFCPGKEELLIRAVTHDYDMGAELFVTCTW